jgi:hypothetical protein
MFRLDFETVPTVLYLLLLISLLHVQYCNYCISSPFGSFEAFSSTLILQSCGNGLAQGTGNVDSKVISCSGFFSSTINDVWET